MGQIIGSYAVIVEGLVTNIVAWDGNSDPATGGVAIPEGEQWVLLEAGQVAYIGYGATQGAGGAWSFDTPPPPDRSPEEILADNTQTRDVLLYNASLAIAPLQDAVDLGIATSDEQSLLTAWKTYRVNVNRVDLSQPDPAWPVAPA